MARFMGKAFDGKRRAVFAGQWYEADSQKLDKQLCNYLTDADNELNTKPEPIFPCSKEPQGKVLALVSPHAGYIFSGKTGAYAYALARRQTVKRVFLLGPSHYVGFRGAALPQEKVFSTPLGDLPVDREVVEELKDYPLFQKIPEVHQKEHSLELQLPFIRKAFGEVKIVPIIIGQLGDDLEVRLIAQLLRRYLNEDDIVVVSSDFTHFGPRYGYEPFHTDVVAKVAELDAEAFGCLANGDLDELLTFHERTRDTICGFFPLAVLTAMLPAGTRASLLNYRTSRDSIMEDERNSVSYLAISFTAGDEEHAWSRSHTADDDEIGELEQKFLLKAARHSIETYLRHGKMPSINDLQMPQSHVLSKPMGAFVTLFSKVAGYGGIHGDKQLRGCIGYIWPVKPLIQAVVENAIGACSRDYRFQNVRFEELEFLQIEISALTPPRPVTSYKDIVIGRDGIVMYKGGAQAVFLPHVATEFGWNLEETLTQLSIKAGCGPEGWRQDSRFDVFRGQSFEEEHEK